MLTSLVLFDISRLSFLFLLLLFYYYYYYSYSLCYQETTEGQGTWVLMRVFTN